jgi:hypothetical protein
MVLLWFSRSVSRSASRILYVLQHIFDITVCVREYLVGFFSFLINIHQRRFIHGQLVGQFIDYILADRFSAVSLVVLTTMSLTIYVRPYTLRLSLTRSSIATT